LSVARTFNVRFLAEADLGAIGRGEDRHDGRRAVGRDDQGEVASVLTFPAPSRARAWTVTVLPSAAVTGTVNVKSTVAGDAGGETIVERVWVGGSLGLEVDLGDGHVVGGRGADADAATGGDGARAIDRGEHDGWRTTSRTRRLSPAGVVLPAVSCARAVSSRTGWPSP